MGTRSRLRLEIRGQAGVDSNTVRFDFPATSNRRIRRRHDSHSLFQDERQRQRFILIDNRLSVVPEARIEELVVGACRRKMSVGADG